MNNQQNLTCEFCGKIMKSKNSKKLHRWRNHKDQYGDGKLKREINQLNQKLEEQNEIIELIQEEKNQRVDQLTKRITKTNIENNQIKQMNLKFGKKKNSQTKVQVGLKIEKYFGNVKSNYAAYKVDVFNEEEINNLNQELCGILADVLVIDPPFKGTMLNLDYDVVDDEVNMSLQVEKLQSSGYIFLWVTKKKLPWGLQFFKKHRYSYSDMIVWEKVDEFGILQGGPGNKLDHQFEICLVGRKKQTWENIQLHIVQDIIQAKRRIASQKPDELYHMIEQLIPNSRYIEIFARSHNIRENWISIGDQIPENIQRKLEHGLIV